MPRRPAKTFIPKLISGDIIEYFEKVNSSEGEKPVKKTGRVDKLTSNMVIVSPDHPRFAGQKDTISFNDIYCGAICVTRLYSGLDVY